MSGKLHISRWMGIALLLLAFACVQAVAQEAAGQAGQAAKQAGSQAGQEAGGGASSMEVSAEVQEKLQKLSSALKLTDDQKTQIKPILQREIQKLKSIRNDPSMSDEQKQAQAQEVHAASHSEIQSLLTPEQQKKLEHMKNDSMQR
jgi:Spy/CpxP family protein refolding chaperone